MAKAKTIQVTRAIKVLNAFFEIGRVYNVAYTLLRNVKLYINLNYAFIKM